MGGAGWRGRRGEDCAANASMRARCKGPGCEADSVGGEGRETLELDLLVGEAAAARGGLGCSVLTPLARLPPDPLNGSVRFSAHAFWEGFAV